MKKSDKPYITKRRIVIERLYNKDFGDEKVCGCGNSYYRHFDSYDGMAAIGCKYCDCGTWHPIANEDDKERERHQAEWDKKWAEEEKLKKQNENAHTSGTD